MKNSERNLVEENLALKEEVFRLRITVSEALRAMKASSRLEWKTKLDNRKIQSWQ